MAADDKVDSRTQPPATTQPAESGSLIFVQTDKELLAAAVPVMTLRDTSLKDAIKTLATLTKKNIVLGNRGLEVANIDVNTPRQFEIAPGMLKDALQTLIKTAAAKTDIVITAEDGVVHIMSQAQADNIVVSKSYYIDDLIGNLPQILSHTPSAAAKAKQEKTTASKPASQPGEPNYDDVIGYRVPGRPAALIAAANSPPPPRSTNIIEVITSAVRPEIWKINGGKIGEIAIVGNQVNIRAPVAVHALLDGPKHYDPNARPRYINYDAGSGRATIQP